REEAGGIFEMGADSWRKNVHGSPIRAPAGERPATCPEADRRDQDVSMEIAIRPAPNAYGAPDDPRLVARAMAPPSFFGDKAFEWLTLAMAMAVVPLITLTGWQLWRGSSLAIQKFGFHFLTTS